MRKNTFYLLLSISILTLQVLNAQYLRLSSSSQNECLGKDFFFKIKTDNKVNLNLGNKFRVYYYYYINNDFFDGNLDYTQLNDSLFTANFNFIGPQNLRSGITLIAYASSPATSSNSIFINHSFPPEVSLSGSSPSMLDLHQNVVYLNFKQKENSLPSLITLDDSLSFEQSTIERVISYKVKENQNSVKIISVQNKCGAGTFSGEIQISRNTIGFKTTSVQNPTLCAGDEILVGYSTLQSKFNQGNKFKLKLISNQFGYAKPIEIIIDVEEKDGLLQGKLPDVIPLNLKVRNLLPTDFKIIVMSSDPVNESDPQNITVKLLPKSIIQLSTNTLISPGTRPYINLKLLGKFNFDGTLFSSDNEIIKPLFAKPQRFDYNGFIDTLIVSVNSDLPINKSRSYELKNTYSGCVANPVVSPEKLNIIVKEEIIVDSIFTYRNYICDDRLVRFRVFTPLNLAANSNFTINLAKNNNINTSFFNANPINLTYEGNNTFSFYLPALSLNSNAEAYTFLLIYMNGKLMTPFTEFMSSFFIKSKPKLYESESDKILNFPSASYVRLSYQLSGDDNYKLEYEDGYRTGITCYKCNFGGKAILFDGRYTPKSVAYKLKSVEGYCGKTEVDFATSVNILNPVQSINLDQIKTKIPFPCFTDSISFNFDPIGAFNVGNVFKIQFVNYENEFSYSEKVLPTAWSSKGGKLIVPSSGFIRIVSTSPVVFSNPVKVEVTNYPTLEYWSNRSEYETKGFISGELFFVGQEWARRPQYFNDQPFVMNVSDGEKLYKIIRYSNLVIPLSKSKTYKIASLETNCGIFKNLDSIKIKVVPFRIIPSDVVGNYNSPTYSACVGSTLSIPFNIESENPIKDLIHTLRIAPINSSQFVDLATTNKSSFVFKIPNNLTKGLYSLQIIEKLSGEKSKLFYIQILQPISAAIQTSASPNNFTDKVTLPLELTGSPPLNLVFNNGETRTIEYSATKDYLDFCPKKGGEFKIVSAFNACGFGTSTGSYQYTLSPTVQLKPLSNQICADGNNGIPYITNGDLPLDFTLYLWINIQGENLLVATSKLESNTFTLNFPKTLIPGYYSLFVTSSFSNGRTLSTINLSITKKLNVRLSGNSNTNINEYTSSNFLINNLDDFPLMDFNYELNTGYMEKVEYQNSKEYIKAFYPNASTIYTIKTISNACGIGNAVGQVKITVNPNPNKKISVNSLNKEVLCGADTIQVGFISQGLFKDESKFIVELSDTLFTAYKPLISNYFVQNNNKFIKAILPKNLEGGKRYNLRIYSDEDAVYSNSTNFISSAIIAQGAFKISEYWTKNTLENVPIELNLTGNSPWTLTLLLKGTQQEKIYTLNSSHIYNTSYQNASRYEIKSIENLCGFGIVLNPKIATIEVVTSLDKPQNDFITTYPNPVDDVITIEIPNNFKPPYQVEIYSENGGVVLSSKITENKTTLTATFLQKGSYILSIFGDKINHKHKFSKL